MSDTLSQQPSVSPMRALLEGDLIAGQRVAGFAWTPPAGDHPSSHLDDRLVLDGDEQLSSPPDRRVPQTAETAECEGIMPPDDLDADRRRPAAEIDAMIPWRADALLNLPHTPWQQVIRPLLGAVHSIGHRLWLAGGAARDVIADVPLREVHDLDLAGTVPPGRFSDVAYQTLRAMQMSEFRITVTPGSLVCSVTPPKPQPKTRLIEYRGLNQGGFRFPTVGSSLTNDADHRDFSFNTLMYDVIDHKVFDPTGAGVDDLLARRFVPVSVHTDPVARAMIIVRATKFALRWQDSTPLDLKPLFAWVTQLPPDLCDSLTGRDWSGLTNAYRYSVDGPKARQLEFAASLPQPARQLIETLIGRLR